MASDRTSQTGEATAGFVQRPTIPPRSRRVISHSPLEIAAEYRAIVMTCRQAGQRRGEHFALYLRCCKEFAVPGEWWIIPVGFNANMNIAILVNTCSIHLALKFHHRCFSSKGFKSPHRGQSLFSRAATLRVDRL